MTSKEINLELWQQFVQHPRLGEILIQHKKISIIQLEKAMDEQKEKKLPIGEILIQQGVLSKNELVEVLELQNSIDKILKDSFNELKKLKENE